MFTLAKKEFKDLFASPIAYVFITVFLFLVFWLFYNDFFLANQSHMVGFFSWTSLLFIIFLPSVTMGKWSEENRAGTQELLFTLPLKTSELVLGKFVACATFLLIVLLLTSPLVLTLYLLGDPDIGQIIASYAGCFLLGCAYIALGLLVSSLTKNQIISFMLSVIVLFIFYVLGSPLVVAYVPKTIEPILQFISLHQHFESMTRGVIDTRDLIYFFSVIGLSIYGNVLALKKI